MVTVMGAFRLMQPLRCGAQGMVEIRDRTCVQGCRRKVASSPCFARLWRETNAIPWGSISVLTAARFLRAWMKVTTGRKLSDICRQYFLSNCWISNKARNQAQNNPVLRLSLGSARLNSGKRNAMDAAVICALKIRGLFGKRQI